MRNVLAVKILQNVKHLNEVVAGDSGIETLVGDEAIKFAIFDVLKYNIGNFLCALTTIFLLFFPAAVPMRV